ncbi:MAG: T9SS type A sorting domain-containing protein [bacterium]
MMRRLTPFIVFLICIEALAIGPDFYQEIGHWPRESVQDASLNQDQLMLLLGNAVSIAGRNGGGLKLEPGIPVALEQNYKGSYLAGNWLYLSDPGGRLGICRVDPLALERVSETQITDSILAVAASGRYLYLAAGVSGIRIVDVGWKSNPRVVGTEQYGVRYTELISEAGYLFAIDALNGVDLFRPADSSLIHLQSLPSTQPVTGIAFTPPFLFLTTGDATLQRLMLTESGEFVNGENYPLAAPIMALTAVEDLLVAALADGMLLLIDPTEATPLNSLQLPFPAIALQSSTGADAAALAITDARGLAYDLAVAEAQFGSLRKVALAGNIEAILPRDETLLIATAAGGITALQFNDDGSILRNRFAEGAVYGALAADGDDLFAAENGSPALHHFRMDDVQVLEQSQTSWALPTSELHLQNLSSGEGAAVISVGVGGAQAASFTSGDLQSLWSLPVEERLVTGFWRENLLGLVAANFKLELYSTENFDSPPQWLAAETLPDSTRTMIYLPSGQLVTAGSYGVSVYTLAPPYIALEWLRDFAGIENVYDLAYDPISQVLVAATGESGAFFLDFSNPEQGATAFPLPGLSGVSQVAVSGDFLYVQATDGLHAFRKSGSIVQPQPALPEQITISESYPNPFNLVVRLAVASPPGKVLSGDLDLEVYNILGQRVWRQRNPLAGSQSYLDWDGRTESGRRAASGLYLLVVSSGDFRVVRKAVLLK